MPVPITDEELNRPRFKPGGKPPMPLTIPPIEQPPDLPMKQSALPMLPAPSFPQAPPIVPLPPTDAQARLAHEQSSKPGADTVKNPVLHTLAKIGDVASAFFPGPASMIPGTTLHHNMLLNEAQGAVNSEASNAALKSKGTLEEAEARRAGAQADVQPELADIKQQIADTQRQSNENRLDLGNRTLTQKQTEGEAARAQKLQLAGLDPESGDVLPDEKLPPALLNKRNLDQAHEAYYAAQGEAARARATNDPKRIEIAEHNLALRAQDVEINRGRLGLSRDTFKARNQGLLPDNTPIVGSQIADSGQVIPPVTAGLNKPTSQQINKADLAQSAVDRVHEMRSIIKARPDLIGPGNGRISKFEMAVGNNDPEALRFKAASIYLADHSAGIFGGRSKYITEGLQSLSDPHFNPASLLAALDEAEKAATHFVEAGKRNTTGSKNIEHGPKKKVYNEKTGTFE